MLCNSQCLVSSETRALCTMPQQHHPSDKSTAPHEHLHCAAACLLYLNSFLREHGIHLWDTNWDTNCDLFNPHKGEYHDYLMFFLLDSILGCYWYIFMSRYKLTTSLIPLRKWQQWHKLTRNAVIITIYQGWCHQSTMHPRVVTATWPWSTVTPLVGKSVEYSVE